MTFDRKMFESNKRLDYLVATIFKYRLLWIAPAIAGLLLTATYVFFFRTEVWSARQSLIVRDDMVGNAFKPGRFESLESMKSAQETILEIARKPQVIKNALQRLGPEKSGLISLGIGEWPNEKTVEATQGAITLSAPNGAELGKTEVIVLNAKGSTRARAGQFVDILLEEIIEKANEVRKLRLSSMVSELEQTHGAAVEALEQSKARLREMDKVLGSDIGNVGTFELADESIQRDISQIRFEKRQTESDIEQATKVLEMLVAARQNPQQFLSTSGDLVKFQPALDSLKKELVQAQKEYSDALGRYTKYHPVVKGKKDAIVAMNTQIHNELRPAILGQQQDINALRQKLERLERDHSVLRERLNRVSLNRVDSLTLLAEVKKRTEIANAAESDLRELQSLTSAGGSVDLITRVDDPEVSTRPDGMGNRSMILAGGIGGLMLGLGLVMLIAPPIAEQNNDTSNPGPSNPSHSMVPTTATPASQEELVTPIVVSQPQSPLPVTTTPTVQTNAINVESGEVPYSKWPTTETAQLPISRETKLNPEQILEQDWETKSAKPTEPQVKHQPEPKPAASLQPPVASSETKAKAKAESKPKPKQVTSKSYKQTTDAPGSNTAPSIPQPSGTSKNAPSREDSLSPLEQLASQPFAKKQEVTPRSPLTPPTGPFPSTNIPVDSPANLSEPQNNLDSTPAPRSPSETMVLNPGALPTAGQTESPTIVASEAPPTQSDAGLQLKTIEQQAEETLMMLGESSQMLEQLQQEKAEIEDGLADVKQSLKSEADAISALKEQVADQDSPSLPSSADSGDDEKKAQHDQQAEILARLMEQVDEMETASDSGLSRRPSNIRPVDLAKSADEFHRSSPAGEAAPPFNPFLQHPTVESEKARPQLEQAAEEASHLPVPDQIKKLTEAISDLAKPVEPANPDEDNF